MFYTFAVEVCWSIYGLKMTFNYHVFWKNHYSNSFQPALVFLKNHVDSGFRSTRDRKH